MTFVEKFELKTALLPVSLVKRNIHVYLEPLEYKRWFIEEFQDQLDELFPNAWDQGAKILILQRIRGGIEPSVEINQGMFLFKIGAWLIGCVFVLLLAASQVDVNAFSLHGLYLNRLVRAYLGASRKPEPITGADPRKRKPDPVTGFDPDDDLLLGTLRASTQFYDGPFPILNAAMNSSMARTSPGRNEWRNRSCSRQNIAGAIRLATGRPTGWRLRCWRKAWHCGGNLWRRRQSNMGYHSSPAVTFLLTVFNARLGAWLGNPKHEECWQDRGPRWGFLYLFRELFGWTDDKSPYVYLSDGGHFENLGAYELIKRRCRYVVVCDAGEDALHAFEDLGNLVRKVRIDLGIRIELAPDCLQLQKDSRHSRWHCAIGKIRYDEVDPETSLGTLVYIKPSLTGDESPDVLHYAASHPTFPHEGTIAHQFSPNRNSRVTAPWVSISARKCSSNRSMTPRAMRQRKCDLRARLERVEAPTLVPRVVCVIGPALVCHAAGVRCKLCDIHSRIHRSARSMAQRPAFVAAYAGRVPGTRSERLAIATHPRVAGGVCLARSR